MSKTDAAASPEVKPAQSASPTTRPAWRVPVDLVVGTLSSVVCGVVLLSVVLVWVAMGTFDVILQKFDFDMIDWYVWWPFQAVLYLMCVNLATVTLRRIPFNLPNFGVWVIHGSILLIGLGSVWFGYTWVDAATRVDKGKRQTFAHSHSHREECFHIWKIDGGGSASPHFWDWTGYSPNDRSTQHPISAAVSRHQFRGGVMLTDATLAKAKAEGATDAIIERVKPLRQRIFGGRDALRLAIERVLVSDDKITKAEVDELDLLRSTRRPWLASIGKELDAITAAAFEDEYRLPTVTTPEGLRFTIVKSWPKVKYSWAMDDVPAEPGERLNPYVATTLGQKGGGAQAFWGRDPIARRISVRFEPEVVDRLQELLQPIYDAGGKNSDALDEARQNLSQQLKMLHRLEARTFVWNEAAVTDADVERAREIYGSERRPGAGKEPKIKPPPQAERVIITDPRLERPILVWLADWQERRELKLDTAGLPGEKLVLEDVGRQGRSTILKYAVVEADGRRHTRVCMGSFSVDPTKIDAAARDPERVSAALKAAEVPVGSKLVVLSVPYRTLAVQGVTVERPAAKPQAPAVREVVPLVWSIEEAGPQLGVEIQGGAYVPWAGDGLAIRIDMRSNVLVRQELSPMEGMRANRAAQIAAEYDYTDEQGVARTWRRTFWLPKTDVCDIIRFESDGATFRLDVPKLGLIEVAWAGKRVPLGFGGDLGIRLDRFHLDVMPGSPSNHREYASYVTVGTAGGDQHSVKICMNEPKKADGYWFSQADYDQELDSAGRPLGRFTVLSVASKPGWSDPPIVPYAFVTLIFGVLWAFLVKPIILAHRRAKMKAASARAA